MDLIILRYYFKNFSLKLINISILKVFYLPEAPLDIQWIPDYVCLGYKKEYVLLCDKNGSTRKLYSTKNNTPILLSLPSNDITFVSDNTAFISDSIGINSSTTFNYQTSSLGFSFPYIFSLSNKSGFLEIKSLVDPQYHEILRPPHDAQKLCLLKDDYRNIYISEPQKVYILKISHTQSYRKDEHIVKQIYENSDNILFVLYIREVLTSNGTVCNKFLKSQIDFFLNNINDESLSLEELKKMAFSAIHRIYKIMQLILANFLSKIQKHLLYLAISIAFHNEVYNLIYEFIKKISFEENIAYMENLNSIKDFPISKFGVRRKFFLNHESLRGVKNVEKTDTQPTEESEVEINGNGENISNIRLSHILENLSLDSQLSTLNKDELTFAGDVKLYVKNEDTVEYEYVDRVKISYDLDYRIFIDYEVGNTVELLFDENKFIFNEEYKSIEWCYQNRQSMMIFEEIEMFESFSNQFRFCSNSNLSESMFTSNHDNESLEKYSHVISPFSAIKSISNRKVFSFGSLRQPSKLEDLRSSLKVKNEKTRSYYFQNDPYRPAYALLRSLPKKTSPREKLECIVKVLNLTVKCIEDFWKNEGRSVVVGADDLLPIFTYVIAKASVPNLPSEILYITEFSLDKTLKGKYSYALTTFQMAVNSFPYIKSENEIVNGFLEKFVDAALPKFINDENETIAENDVKLEEVSNEEVKINDIEYIESIDTHD